MEERRIPLLYRLFFLCIEPVSALFGAYFSFFDQPTYLFLTHFPSAPHDSIPVSTQIVLSQLSNLYLLFAINEAVVLRSTKDLRVWKAVLFGLLVADFGHLWSVNVLGWDIYWKFERWNAIDWGNIGFVYVGALMRSCFLLGVGLKTPGRQFTSSEETEEKADKAEKSKHGVSELFAGLEISLTGFDDCALLLHFPKPLTDITKVDHREEIGNLILEHGGQYRGDLYKDQTTHLIAKDAVGAKYDAARKWGVEIVTIEWLLRTIDEEELQDENLYRLNTFN